MNEANVYPANITVLAKLQFMHLFPILLMPYEHISSDCVDYKSLEEANCKNLPIW